MHRCFTSFVFVLLATAHSAFGQTYDSGLVEIVIRIPPTTRYNGGEPKRYVGEVIRENDKAIEIRDLDGKVLPYFKKTFTVPERNIEVKLIVNRLDEESAVTSVGLAQYLAWHISKRLHTPGTVLSADSDGIYVNKGSEDWLTKGQKLTLYRIGGEVIDSKTRKSYGKKRNPLGTVVVEDVSRNNCRVKLEAKDAKTEDEGSKDPATVNVPPITAQVGDEVSIDSEKAKIAVIPLMNLVVGSEIPGKTFAEELTTALVRLEIPVVERALLERILGSIERDAKGKVKTEFNPEAVANLGRQLGAHYIIAGTFSFVEGASSPDMYVRLINVETGEILFAAQKRNPVYVGGRGSFPSMSGN